MNNLMRSYTLNVTPLVSGSDPGAGFKCDLVLEQTAHTSVASADITITVGGRTCTQSRLNAFQLGSGTSIPYTCTKEEISCYSYRSKVIGIQYHITLNDGTQFDTSTELFFVGIRHQLSVSRMLDPANGVWRIKFTAPSGTVTLPGNSVWYEYEYSPDHSVRLPFPKTVIHEGRTAVFVIPTKNRSAVPAIIFSRQAQAEYIISVS